MNEGLVAADLVVRAGRATVLDGRSLEVPPGTLLAVQGDVGSGKTTVLEVLAGRRRPAAGSVTIGGAPAAAARTGWLDQEHALPGGLTAAENVAVPLLARGALGGDGWATVEGLLDAVGVPPANRHNLLEELSGGQQQRVAIARALAGDPVAILLDDPTSELDGETAETVWRVLRAAAEQGAVIVVASPESDDAARCDVVLRLERAAPVSPAARALPRSARGGGSPRRR